MLTASCVLVIDVVATCCVVVFECEPLCAVTGCPAVCEPVVVAVGWGNATAAEPCFGVTLAVEGVFAVSSPKKMTQKIHS